MYAECLPQESKAVPAPNTLCLLPWPSPRGLHDLGANFWDWTVRIHSSSSRSLPTWGQMNPTLLTLAPDPHGPSPRDP